jgi:hypothetical protein
MILSVEDRNFDLYINFYDMRTGKKISKKLNQISKKLKVAMSLEVSLDDSTVFLAGCDNLDMDKATPVISAVSFDENIKEMACLDLNCQEMSNIYNMRRIENTNTMLLSGKKIISIIQYRDRTQQFSELKQLRNIHTGPIYSFTLRGKDIFSVSPSDNYVHKF